MVKKTINIIISYIGLSMFLRNYTSYKNAIFIGLFMIPFLINFINSNKKSNSKMPFIILSIILSISLVIGTQLELNSFISKSFFTFFEIVFFSFFLYNFSKVCFITFIGNKRKKKINIKLIKNNRNIFILLFIPALILYFILYPGIYGYDSPFQLYSVVNNAPLTTHFSILYMLIFGYITKMLSMIFNSYTIGFSLYILIQMLFMTCVSYRICLFVKNKTKNDLVTLLSVLYFSLNILLLTMICSASQDVLFAGMFCLLLITLYEFVDCKNDKPKYLILFIEIVFLMLLRNNGLHCVVFMLLVSLFLKMNNKKKFIATIIIAIFVNFIITGPIYKICGVIKGDNLRESLSIPCQQIARAYVKNYSSLSEDEILKINYYFDNAEWLFEYYEVNESISDYQKGALNEKKVKKDLTGFIYLWLKIGKKNIVNYTEAALLNNLGLWYLNKDYYDSRMSHHFIEWKVFNVDTNSKWIRIKKINFISRVNEIYNSFMSNYKYLDIPIFKMIFIPGTLFFITLITIIVIISKKRIEYLVPMSLITGLYITLALAPVILYRYILPIAMSIPIDIAIIYRVKSIIKK